MEGDVLNGNARIPLEEGGGIRPLRLVCGRCVFADGAWKYPGRHRVVSSTRVVRSKARTVTDRDLDERAGIVVRISAPVPRRFPPLGNDAPPGNAGGFLASVSVPGI